MLPKKYAFLISVVLFCFPITGSTADTTAPDPFQPYLADKPPEILREIPNDGPLPEGVTIRRVVFLSRQAPTASGPVASEIFAIIASPKTPGKHPGMLVLHGGGGAAEVDKAIAWAQRGYVAVAPDLPGIAEPKKLTQTTGWWKDLKYGEGRYMAKPDASGSVLFDAVLSGVQSLHLLRTQPDVDPSRIGVVGISWGGYMTTMVCGLSGDQVRAGFAIFGCGFYELTSQEPTLLKMPPEEREIWLKYLDAGRRAPGIRSAFFTAGAANDFFFWPRAVQATLDAIPGEKNHLFAPNSNHKVPLPGGTVFPKPSSEPFTPTPFQPFPTPSGSKANWLAMEVPYFDFYLKDIGKSLPIVTVLKSDAPFVAHFKISAPMPMAKVEVFWSNPNPDWMKRPWASVPATKTADNSYQATLPAEATPGALWFVVASDERPVTVSSDLMQVPPPSPAPKPAQ